MEKPNKQLSEEAKRLKIIEETITLVGAAANALAQTLSVQSDEDVRTLIQQAMFRQLECNYWLTESLNILRIKTAKPTNVKAN